MFKKLFKSFTQITVNSIDIKFIKQELRIIEKLLKTPVSSINNGQTKVNYINFLSVSDLNYNLIKSKVNNDQVVCLKDANGNIYNLYCITNDCIKFQYIDTSNGYVLNTIELKETTSVQKSIKLIYTQ